MSSEGALKLSLLVPGRLTRSYRSANEDDNPFDSDSDSEGDGDDDEFMPRGQREDPTKGKSSQKKFSPTKVEKNNPGKEGAGEAEKPKVRRACYLLHSRVRTS